MAKFTKAMLLSCLLAVPSIASLYNADTEQFAEEVTEQTGGELEKLASGEDATDVESVENDDEDYDEDDDEDYDEDDEDGDDEDEDDREEEENNDDEDVEESPERQEEDFMNHLDKNKDGKLSKDEIFPYGPGPEDLHPKQDPMLDLLFAKFDENLLKLDKDGDKLINREELPSYLELMLEADHHFRIFVSLDENQDGKLDEQEIFKGPKANTPDMAEKMIAHFRKHLKNVDKDGDSMISLEELPALLASAAEFEMEQEKGMREDVKKPGKKPAMLASAAKFLMEQEKGMRKDVKKPGKK